MPKIQKIFSRAQNSVPLVVVANVIVLGHLHTAVGMMEVAAMHAVAIPPLRHRHRHLPLPHPLRKMGPCTAHHQVTLLRRQTLFGVMEDGP